MLSRCIIDYLTDICTFVDVQARLARDGVHTQKGHPNGLFEDSPSGFLMLGLCLEAVQYVCAVLLLHQCSPCLQGSPCRGHQPRRD
jgi:hypothetical protein